MSDETGSAFCREVIRYMEARESNARQGPDLILPREDEPTDDMADLVGTPEPL